jgi:hypothetical protein
MAFVAYSGPFENLINEFCNPANIHATAGRFADLEKLHGPYAFGKFAKYVLKDPDEFKHWERDAGGIPASIRHRLTEVISTNLKSKTPLPMMLKVGANVDASHDLIVEVFAHKGSIYIGLLMLCPNPELK